MNILVTGAAGFIGSHLTEKLLQLGHHVTGIDNFDPFYSADIKKSNLEQSLQSRNFSFHQGNINDIESILHPKSSKIDLVVHLAAKAGVRPSIENPAAYISTNIGGTQQILEWMKKSGIKKLVFASSSSVYGNNKKTPFTETDPVDFPISPYAFTKKACELLNYNYYHLYQFSIINLRFFTVYGPRQRPDLAIHQFFKNIYDNKTISVFGDGSTGRDYTFIDDIITGVLSAIQYLQHSDEKVYDTFNLGNSSPVLLSDLIEAIENVTERKAIRKYMPMQEGDVDLTFANIAHAGLILDYKPATLLFDGLIKFKNWFETKNIINNETLR